MADKRTWQYEAEHGDMLANIWEYEGARCIRFVCEFADPPSAEDAALMIAAKNATQPADSALADVGHNITQQDIDDISRVLCWLKDGDTPPAAAIDRIVKRNAELRGIVDALRARAVPDCATCVNRGRVRGLSQDTYCEDCIFGTPYKLNHYASKSGDGKGGE